MRKNILIISIIFLINNGIFAQLSYQIFDTNIQAACDMYQSTGIDFSYKIASVTGFEQDIVYFIGCIAFLIPIEYIQLDLGSNFIPVRFDQNGPYAYE